MTKRMDPALSGQAGMSLIEIIIASAIGLVAMAGILYMFNGQHRNMVNQTNASALGMNAQYTLNESEFYLSHIGLGLPNSLNGILIDQGELVIKMNPSKQSADAIMEGSSSAAATVYEIPAADSAIFDGIGRAVVMMGSLPVEAEITSVAAKPGSPDRILVTLAGDKADFPARTPLYPEDRLKLHICKGTGSDAPAEDFRILHETPGKRAGVTTDSLTLAEGVESLTYRYIKLNHDSVDCLPPDLDSLLSIHVEVVTKTRIPDAHLPGDGIQRQSLASTVNYRRSL